MPTNPLIERKRKLEADLLAAISALTYDFYAETNLSVKDVSVEFVNVDEFGSTTVYVITGVRCSVSLD